MDGGAALCGEAAQPRCQKREAEAAPASARATTRTRIRSTSQDQRPGIEIATPASSRSRNAASCSQRAIARRALGCGLTRRSRTLAARPRPSAGHLGELREAHRPTSVRLVDRARRPHLDLTHGVEPGRASAHTSGRRRSTRASPSATLSSPRSRERRSSRSTPRRTSPATTPSATSAIPGEFPFTRGVYPSMYRGRLWTMRQFAGFGTAEETNERFRYLLDHGQTGLSTAFDMPTLMGHDSDHPRCARRGRGARASRVDTLDDMETLFGGIPLDEVTTSMTINAPAAILLAFYVCAAEEQGVPPEQARRHDPDRHPEGVHRPEGVVLPDRAGDAAGHRHDRVRCSARCRAGTRSRSPATTSARPARRRSRSWPSRSRTGFTYVEEAIERGLDVDDFAPRLSFFFNAHIDFFEEIAKYRAARRIWAREMREHLRRPRPGFAGGCASTRQTAGVSLTAQQPLNNIVRTALEALPAVLGGTQSPAHQLLRRGARAADRGGGADRAAHPADHRPRDRRHEHDRPARRQLLRRDADRRDGAGRLRATSPHRRARRHGRGDQAATSRSARSPTPPSATSARSTRASGWSSGSTSYVEDEDDRSRSCSIDPAFERKQIERLQATRARRDSTAVERTLAELKRAAADRRTT